MDTTESKGPYAQSLDKEIEKEFEEMSPHEKEVIASLVSSLKAEYPRE